MTVSILIGDCREKLAGIADSSVQCCVTSPPYFGLRDYGVDGQMGLEKSPDEFVAGMVEVFREVRRTLRDDGTLWLNIGDSYAGSWGAQGRGNDTSELSSNLQGGSPLQARSIASHPREKSGTGSLKNTPGCKPKDLIGIPWLLAFALRADGWYLRQDIIWSKPNPMPESVRDRCTKAHEYLFMLSKSPRYFYDAEAIKKPPSESSIARWSQDIEGQEGSARVPGKTNGKMKAVGGPRRTDKQRGHGRRHDGFNDRWDALSREEQLALGANKRSVWEVATKPFGEAHFATYPPELIEPCIKAGSRPGDMILDPFGGAGTTALVADRLKRDCTLIELNPKYAEIARRRIEGDGGMFTDIEVAA